jgi:hypothetical protein
MKINIYILLIISIVICYSCISDKTSGSYKDDNISYEPVSLTDSEKQILIESLSGLHERYDSNEKMLTKTLTGWNYHTDAQTGTFHEVRASFNYAVALLDIGDEQYTQRAFDIIEKTITLQDQDSASRSCGVWPYYLEEPLATKKAPIDFNWADFNAVSLLDVWMGHQKRIPDNLRNEIKESLILAAKSVQKRNVGPSYTNIAIMGTYVTYMVSHLFDIPEMQDYSKARLQRFYDYTLDKGGFTEYNSPTYTIVALDELSRMQKHIINPEAKTMIDSLYSIGWEMIARYYHKPSGQWAGPHSRSYSTLVRPSFYAILNQASNGQINLPLLEPRMDVKIKHNIPEFVLHYFLSPVFPRIETDIFEKVEPQTIGTAYLTEKYALSTANRSSLWNQRRPFLVYWGNIEVPKYLQIRFLHDDYDFSSATFYSQQNENNVLAGLNFILNGGDKHISIDRLKDGKFMAKDLRIRFEFGNVSTPDILNIPVSKNEPFSMIIDDLKFDFQMFIAEYEGLKGYWEKGGNEKASWIDFVFYSGAEKDFDLTKITKAVSGFTFSIDSANKNQVTEKPDISEKDGQMDVIWKGLKIQIPVKPLLPKNTFI